MKKLLLILTLVLSITISSCKKKDNPPPSTPPTKPFYFKFTLDGAAKSFTNTNLSLHTGFGGGSYTSSGFFNFQDDISITLSMPLDSIIGSDLQSLVGQKIPIGSCGGCPTNIHLQYAINGNDYESYDTHNPFPAYYIKFNNIIFDKQVMVFDELVNQYYVAGEFNLKLSYGTDVKNASNGTFKLIFRESRPF